MPIITMAETSEIEVGEKVVLCSESESTALGVSRPVILRTLRPGARISIGDYTGLSGTVVCAAIGVEIGAECLIGADVQIVDTDFHAIQPEGRYRCNDPDKIAAAPVRIGRNVFIGAGSKILKGVTIGENSVIGAGSIVTRDIPPDVIVAGNPARVIGPLSRV
jgi:acetyltransferase-like isoleucine patch superfamily enzyme